MSTATKAELEAQVKRLTRSLNRAKAEIAALARANAKVTTLRNAVAEGRAREKASAEILRAISNSPTDIQPVFDRIAAAARRLIGGVSAAVIRLEGDLLHLAAFTSTSRAGDAVLKANFPRPLSQATGGPSRAIRSKAPYCVSDTEKLPDTHGQTKMVARARGHRSALAVPLLRDNVAVGAINVTRREPGAFSEQQIQLLQTFAAQAVIAIENARLFNETKEALAHQAATADVLQVISKSPTDTKPVFDAIVNSGLTLFSGLDVSLRLVRGAHHELVASTLRMRETADPFPCDDDSYPASRAMLSRGVLEVQDILAADWVNDRVRRWAEQRGWRATVIAPMLRESTAIGVMQLLSPNSRPFTDKQINLLKTFADQAVIAIENVRLFRELQARNAEVTEALEQQTATAEILRVISSSPTNLQPVFDAILEKATQLCDSHLGLLGLFDGDYHQFVAVRTGNPDVEKWALNRGPFRPRAGGGLLQLLRDGKPWQEADLRESTGYRNRSPMHTHLVEQVGVRSFVSVPMLKEGRAIGEIQVYRAEVQPFTQKEIDLVSTFANQAVIAIENVRLFNEIQEKSRQLEIANRHKSEFLANMSHELRTPLNAVIGFSEILQQGMVGALNEKQNEYTNYIHTSGSHLLSLINDILDLSKVEAGRMELDVTHFSVPMAIDNALTLIKERATRHGLTLESAIDPLVAEIDGDERKFKQVMLNLLSNAVKFTPDGGRITVAARPIDGMLEVSVTDTGIGIAPEDCAAVFEEFRQVGTHTEAKAQGTGLGLALTKRFVELHGGRLWLTSAPGEGSTFSFSLPIAQPEAQTTV